MSEAPKEQVHEIDRELMARVREDVAAKLAVDDMTVEQVERVILETTRRAMPGGNTKEVEELARVIGDDFLRYGPLQPLMDDPQVSEIMVSGGGRDPESGEFLRPRVFVEVGGVKRSCPSVVFESEEHLVNIVNRIGRRAQRRCDEANPMMDAQLPDGSRVNAVNHTIAIDGQTLNIRKFRPDMTPEQLVAAGACSLEIMEFLASCVCARISIIVTGGTGSGKTTMLNALSSFIPDQEHIVVVEDTAELQLHHSHVDRLQARPMNSEGEGAVDMHALVVNTLRMYPDRIVVGECRSVETIEMLQAMQTGHDGSLTTVHANSATSAFSRIVTMARESTGLEADVIKQQIAEAVDLIVHTEKLRSGRRVIKEVIAVNNYADGVIGHTRLFNCVASDDGNTVRFRGAGTQPHAIKQRILDAGMPYRAEWFFDEGGY